MSLPSPASAPLPDDAFGLAILITRIRKGIPLIIGWACVGAAISALVFTISSPFQQLVTTTRVVFSFPGFERGEYPDKSKFSPDDIRSPEIVAEALKRKNLPITLETQAQVRAALSIEGIIPESIVKERDRLRAAGQTPRVYMPDEYTLSLTLPRKFPLRPAQREELLSEIVSIYKEKFTRTYANLPLNFGNAFDSLGGADYFDYELILNQESNKIVAFLTTMTDTARSYRSPRTNLSFGDLLNQSQLFTQLRLNETLGVIREYGLSINRKTALIKLDYHFRTLEDQYNQAVEEERVVQALLDQTRERMQNYVLGVRSQVAQQRPEAPIIDQGLVDSLLANDAYNFLVRQALEAGLKTKRLQSQIAILKERRDLMRAFSESSQSEQSEVLSQMEKSLAELNRTYATLVADIRQTHEDYQRQLYGNAISISMQATTDSYNRSLAMAGIAGLAIGLSFGLGLSLLGVGPGRATSAAAA